VSTDFRKKNAQHFPCQEFSGGFLTSVQFQIGTPFAVELFFLNFIFFGTLFAARPSIGAPPRLSSVQMFFLFFFEKKVARDLLHRKPRAGQEFSDITFSVPHPHIPASRFGLV